MKTNKEGEHPPPPLSIIGNGIGLKNLKRKMEDCKCFMSQSLDKISISKGLKQYQVCLFLSSLSCLRSSKKGEPIPVESTVDILSETM